MGLLDYKHKNEELKKPAPDVDFDVEITTDYKFDMFKKEMDDLNDLEKTQDGLIKDLKKVIASETVTVNPLFDDTLISNLNILSGIIKEYIPDYTDYYTYDENGNAIISLRAFIDARDYLLNELDIDIDNLDRKTYGNSIINKDKLYYSNGISIDQDGIIRKNKKVLFNPGRPQDIQISSMDFEKEIITFNPGVHIAMKKFKSPDIFYKELVVTNPYFVDKNKKKYYFEDLTADTLFKLFGIKKGNEILKQGVLNPKFHPLYDVLDTNPDLDSIKKGMTVCTSGKINYFYLMFLLLIGGGDFAKRPLPGKNDPSATIKQGKVGAFSIECLDINGSNNGCNNKNYKVGHPMMYSDAKPFGMKTSILQTIHGMASFIFGLNIPKIRLYIRIRIFKKNITIVDWTIIHFTCIGGWLEILLFEIQEFISKEITKLLKCDTTYSTPSTDKNGEGLTFFSSKNPICKSYDFTTNICINDLAPSVNKKRCDLSNCTDKSCPSYVADESFYTEGRITNQTAEEQGSAIIAIISK